MAALGGLLSAAGALTPGCNLVNPPKPEPTPTVVPTPAPDIFDPADGVTPLAPLNGGPGQTAKFRVVNILSGELLQMQSLTGTAPNYVGGTADVYRLAGIVTPAPGQPGHAETVALIARWTLGQDKTGQEKTVDVEQDPRFPQDLDGRRMVQVFYTPTEGKLANQRLLLNRMLIRLGYAVVDINAPTSIDVRAWLNDEEYARKKRLGLNALGITLAQRIPLTPSAAVSGGASARPGAVPGRPGTRPGGPARPAGRPVAPTPGARRTTTTSTTTTTTTVPGGAPTAAPGAPAAAPAGSSNAAPGGAPSAPAVPPPGGPPAGGAPAGGPPPGGAPLGGPPPGGAPLGGPPR